MKCDKLKVYKVYTTRNEGAFGFCEGADPTDIELEHESVCLKSDVDKVIAELKSKLESVQASAYADSVDAGMRERRLRRALYKACAMWADRTRLICSVFGSDAPKIRWERMKGKCLKKAEEYK